MKKLLLRLLLLLIVTQSSFAQWEKIGLSDKSISDIEVRDSDIFVITSDDGALYCYKWLDGHFIWFKIVEANAEDIAITTSGKLFLVKDDSLFYSRNNGGDWTSINIIEQIADSLPYGTGSVKKIFLNSNGTIFCYFTYRYNEICREDGFALSNDGGLTWKTPNLFMSGRSFAYRNEFVLTNGYASCMSGSAGGSASYLSTDFGDTWKVTNVLGAPLEFFSNGNIIAYGYVNFDATGLALIMSKDTCQSWLEIDALDCQVSMSLSNGSAEHLMIGTKDSGVFLYSDEGKKLGPINEGLTNLNIQSLTNDNNGFIYAGTENGIWRRSLSEITSVEEKRELIPLEYFLRQNYPNPFNPTTKIRYSIPNYSLVTLKVFDILGREIETLINEEKTAGIYEINFDASQLSSGIYFYQIKAGDFIQTKKMILLK